MISAKIVKDSIAANSGVRLVTMQLIYPRFIHSEFMTHRVFSRNAASSRAIPIAKMIEQVRDNPAMPVYWGKNQAGMQAREELVDSSREEAIKEWREARLSAIKHVEKMVAMGVHKQLANRLLEPWQYMQTIVTATEWTNFYTLRRHPDAQPEIKALADEMDKAMNESKPTWLNGDQWHLPYVGGCGGTKLAQMKKWSTARSARVSYLTHDKQNPDEAKDEDLHDKLLESGHFSPFEHQATPGDPEVMYANFRGWKSYRSELGF